MSQLKVNSIVPINGLPSGASGGIIQTVQTVKTDTTSTYSTTMVDCSGMAVTITPSSSSNKILVTVIANVGAASGYRAMFRILRGSTAIGIGTDVSNRQACGMSSRYHDNGVTHNAVQTFLDSPATTSATTYSVRIGGSKNGTTNYFVNRPYQWSDDNRRATGISTLTLMEVSA